MKKKVRIKDIADRAGVSTGTVDRVLHNRGNVAPEVKKKVLKVVEELGYERNLLASALAYNRTMRICSMLPEPGKDLYWSQVYFGVTKAQKAVQHYGLLIEHYHFDYFNPESFLETAQLILESKPDGVLFPPMFFEEAKWLLQECKSRNIPNVIINTNIEGGESLCYIGQDSYQSGVLGARLLSFGGNPDQPVCLLNLEIGTKAAQHLIDKERGFRDYFTKSAANKQIDVIRKDFEGFNEPEQLKAFLIQLLKDYPTLSGIFVTNSRAHKIIECYEQITELNIRIVGFDLIESNLNYLKENKINFLINQNPSEQGFQGIISLFNHLILKKKVEKIQYLPLDIVVRENVEYYVKKNSIFDIVL